MSSIDDAIISAYNALARGPGSPVGLSEIRARVSASPAQVNAALIRLLHSGRISLEPEPHRHRLTAASRAAAIHVGGEDRHLMLIY